MKLTEKQKQEIVDFNVNQARRIIVDAELCNKGRHSHGINSTMSWLKDHLNMDLKYDTKEFEKMCELKIKLAGHLYMAKNSL